MMANPGSRGAWPVLGKILILILIVGAIVLSGRFSALWSGTGLAFILVGGAAMILMDFSISEIGTGLKWTAGPSVRPEDLPRISYFWEAAGRNFWLLGALGTVINFILALAQVSKGEGGLQVIALGMTSAFRPSLYGLILAVICAVPALKAHSALGKTPESLGSESPEAFPSRQRAGLRVENIIGYLLFLGMLGWSMLPTFGAWRIPPWPGNPFLDWPALLVVGGAAVLLFLFLGRTAENSASGIFGLSGFIGVLIGLLLTLFGFAGRVITDVGAGLALVVSSCFLALFGIIFAGAPWEDRLARFRGERASIISRLAWYVFPLLTQVFMILVLILVITPIKKTG
jgi:hypothetical protein